MMGGLMAPKVDAGELFFQRERRLGWSLEDGKIKEGTFGASGGVGVRAISGEKTGFAYADDISRDALTPALAAARAIVKSGASTAPPSMPAMFEPAMTAQTGDAIHVLDDPILGMSNEARIDMMRRVDAVARAVDNRVSKVSVSLQRLFALSVLLSHIKVKEFAM